MAYVNYKKIMIVFLAAWVISPPLQGNMLCRLVCIAMVVLLLVSSQSKPTYVLLGLIVIFYTVIVGYFVDNDISRNMALYLIIGYTFCTSYLKQEDTVADLAFIITLTLVLMSIWNGFTIRALIRDPHIMRYLVKNEPGYVGFGVGGYGHAYTAVLLIPFALNRMFGDYPKSIKVIGAIYCGSSIYMIFKSGYLIAILTMMTGMFSYIILQNHNRRNILVLLFVLFCTIVLIINADEILLFLIEHSPIGQIRLKLQSMYDILIQGSDIDESIFSVRYERYTRDVKLFFQSPLWGVLEYVKVGKHSKILDFFAQYGLPIGVATLYTLFEPLRENNRNPVAITVIIEYFLILLFNNESMSMSILYILMPIYFGRDVS